MSEDMIRTSGSTRAYEAFAVEPADGPPRRFDNPLVKGLLVLLMLAVATTVLVATEDEGERTVVAGPAIASESVEPATPSSVQQVASNTAQADAEPADPAADTASEPEAWAAGLSALTVERNRQAALDATTTTAAPTTTVPSTTAAPTTAAPTTTPSTTAAAAADTDSTADSTDAAATESTEPAESTTTETTTEATTETTAPATTEAPTTTAAPTTESTANPDGWVDAGHGVLVPRVLIEIRWCESRDIYDAANPVSSARGAYQFLTGSWAAYGHADRYGVTSADKATNAQQDEAALLTWQRDGTRPWNASKSCWQSRI
ncbi:MAG: transglycosylase family protein [Actinomycetota bacterium]